MLQRYIANEINEPDFLLNKEYTQIKEEILLLVYLAGHGCADTKRYLVLNEDTLEKVFWPAEQKFI